SGSEFPVGTTAVSFQVTDASGNTTTCAFTVTVEDKEKPELDCPADLVVSTSTNGTGDCSGAVPDLVPGLVATDNCGVSSTVQSPAAGSSFGSEHGDMAFVTLTVTDIHGNTQTCKTKLSLQDDEAPSIDCNVANAFDNTPGICGHLVDAADNTDPVFGDNCEGAQISHDYPAAPNSHTLEAAKLPVGTTTVIWTATDAAGNTTTCAVEYTVSDNILPEFVNCPSNAVLNNDIDKCGAQVIWPDPIAKDECGATVTQTGGPVSGQLMLVGTHTITYVATDPSGNTALCSWTITVNDAQLPDIECPAGIQYLETNNGNCSHTVSGTLLDPSVVENCAVSSLTNNYNNGNSLNAAVFPQTAVPAIVTWMVSDNHGNTATCSFAVIVMDNDAPVVASCPSDIIQSNDAGECSAIVNYATPTFNDNCGGAAQPGSLVQGLASGSTFPPGTTVVEYWYSDQTGNGPAVCAFTVTVYDAEQPAIECPADVVVDINGSVTQGNAELVSSGPCGVTLQYEAPAGTDNCDNPVTANIGGLGAGPSYYEYGGVYTETWQVSDQSGNTATCSFTITVEDPVTPTIVCPANVTLSNDPGECDAAVTYAYPYFGDNCPNYTLAQISGPASGDEFPAGTTSVSFQVTDNAGNSTLCAFTVTVHDLEKPVIVNCPADRIVNTNSNGTGDCSGAIPNLLPEVVATDNCAISTTTQTPASGSFGSYNGDQMFVTITVTDIYGNTQTCKTKLTLRDNESPTINCANVPVQLNNTPGQCSYFVQGFNLNPQFGDNCGPLTLTNTLTGNNTLGGTNLPLGSTNVTWMVTDAAGNTASCAVTYVVQDNEPPVAACQGPVIDVVLDGDGVAQLTVSDVNNDSWDNCGPLASKDIKRATGGNFAQSVYFGCDDATNTENVILQVIDQSGNVSTCTTAVHVYDLEVPVITCPNGVETTTDEDACTATVSGIHLQDVQDNCAVTIFYSISGATTASGQNDASGTVFNKGTSTVTYTVTDGSGNTSNCSFDVEVEDHQAPALDCAEIAGFVRSNNADQCSYEVYGDEFDPSDFWDNCPGATIRNNYNHAASLDGAVFPVGETMVVWTVTDASGNTTTCTSRIRVEDHQAPQIACPDPNLTQFTNNNGQCSKTILSEILDPTYWDNCPETELSHDYVTAPNTFTLAGATFPVGSTTVVWTVTDASGNQASCSITVEVSDTEAPAFLDCPTNMLAAVDVDLCSAYVNFDTPIAEDNCSVSVAQTAGPLSGSAFPVGSTTIAFTATDAGGNTAICSFQVIVEETQAPAAVCQDATIALDANGAATITTATVNGGSSDNCGIASMTISTSDFGCTNLGDNNVTLTVTDNYGNTASCVATVTVVDNTLPTFTCPSAITVNSCDDVVPDVTSGITDASDNCSVVSITQDPPAGVAFGNVNGGATTITVTVTD
ncbi:MAG: HYR domain-containing protein, partial [Saprospiraceae bacterium]|nr:HYR domain-containing protein [Saprospiraceae bacterium]